MKHIKTSIFFAGALLFFSCSSGSDSDIMTYQVSRGDFKHVLKVSGVVESVSSTTITCPLRVDGFITELVEDGTMVQKGDTVCVVEDAGLLSDYEQYLLDIEQAEGELAKLIVANELEMALLQADFYTNIADAKMAQIDSLQLLYMPPSQRRIKELEMRTAMLQREKIERKMKLTPMVQRTNVMKQEMSLNRMKRYLAEIEERIAGLTMIAPRSGVAIRAESAYSWDKLKIGDNVWSRMAIVSIPDMDEMKIKISASETEFKYINEGDSVTYEFGAMPGETAFGRIITKISAGRPITRGSKVKAFEIEASIDSVSRMPDPGLTADCYVVLQEQKDVIVIPQITIFAQDSLKVVYVKNKRGFEMRQVETGLTSSKEAVITAGLKGDEIITFSKPKESHIKTYTLLDPETSDPAADEKNMEMSGDKPDTLSEKTDDSEISESIIGSDENQVNN